MRFYENVRASCAKRGTTITEVLHAIGRSAGSTGTWKAGGLPNIMIVIEIADFLNLTIEEILYGEEEARQIILARSDLGISEQDAQYLQILHAIPEDKQALAIDFLKTHMARPIHEKMALGNVISSDYFMQRRKLYEKPEKQT